MKRLIAAISVALLLVLGAGVLLQAGGQREASSDSPFWCVHGPFALEYPAWAPEDFRQVKKVLFPEGCIGYGFETWLMLFNSGNADATIILRGSGESGYYQTAPFKVKAHQRRTIDIAGFHKTGEDKCFKTNPDISVEVLSDNKDVYAQVSMYWNNRAGGHTSTGFTELVGSE